VPADARPDALANARRLYELINVSWVSHAVYAAAELRIPDALAGGPREVAALALACDCDAASLGRLLRALATLDVCRQRADGAFELTPLGALLCDGAPGSLRAWAIHAGKYLWPLWGRLAESVRTGASDRKRGTGTDDYGHLERDREAAAVFNRAMVEVTRMVAGEVVRVCDFARIDSVRRRRRRLR
jgi:hypothetical protein